MASGSYKGSSIKVPDLLLLGGLAIGGYFLYKTIVKPTATIGNAGADLLDTAGDTGESFLNIFKSVFDKIGDGITKTNNNYYPTSTGSTTQEILNQGQTIFGLSGNQIVSNIEKSSRSSRNSGKSVVITPVYDKTSGIGVDSSGFGYSSAFDLGSRTTSKTNPLNVFTNKIY